MTDEMSNWITTTEAAERLGVTPRWITTLITRGELAGRKLNPRLYLVYAPDLETYRDKNIGRGKKNVSKSK